MSDTALQAELLRAAVAGLPADRLSEVRSAALASFTANGFPTTRDEDWKYTNLSGAAALSNTWLRDMSVEAVNDESQVNTAATDTIDAHWIEIRNGEIDPESLL